MDIPRVAVADQADLIDALDMAGCCIVEAAADRSTMNAIAAELAEYRQRASVGASAFEGYRTRRTGSPLPRSATFRSIVIVGHRIQHHINLNRAEANARDNAAA